MPLHLLGKKSWNVYNTDNIARVRRDEAAARAEEEQKERQLKDQDADDRLRILRGDAPSDSQSTKVREVEKNHSEDLSGLRKRRRLTYEEDSKADARYSIANTKAAEVDPIVDENGNIRLVSEPKPRSGKVRNDVVSSVGVKLQDAVVHSGGGLRPWYTEGLVKENTTMSCDVWGNEDAGRRDREQQRLTTSDPLLAIKRGVKSLKEHEQRRKAWREQREKDLYEVEEMARKAKRSRRHKRRGERHGRDNESLKDFNLEADDNDHNSGQKRSQGELSDHNRSNDLHERRSHGHRRRHSKDSVHRHTHRRTGSRHKHRQHDEDDC